MGIEVYIKENTDYYYPVRYVVKLIEKNQDIQIKFLDSPNHAQVIWDHSDERSQPICLMFYKELASRQLNPAKNNYFSREPAIFDEKGNKDIAATIFYMVNCCQELTAEESAFDHYGRFKYDASYQYRFDRVEENLVQQEIDLFMKSNGLSPRQSKTTLFISHDIDSIYGSFFQDGFWALKKMNPFVVLKLIVHELMKEHHWKNIDRVIKINGEYDVYSTFFWLVNKGKSRDGVINADYDLRKEQRLVNMVSNSGSHNGLHKSCSTMGIDDELQRSNLKTTFNRYHFLKFRTWDDWPRISDSQLQLDCSLGFAERYGFRNSYGKPFQPFDISKNKPFDFVEMPLHVMDTTLFGYMKIPVEAISEKVIGFFEKHNYNCTLSLLWHNTSFTDYKFGPLLKEYKKIMGYLYESKVKTSSPYEVSEAGCLNL